MTGPMATPLRAAAPTWARRSRSWPPAAQCRCRTWERSDSNLEGFSGGFREGTYGHAIRNINGDYFVKVARWRLSALGHVEVINPGELAAGLRGGFGDRIYGYAMPFWTS